MGRRTAAIWAALGAGLALLGEVLILFGWGAAASGSLRRAALPVLLGVLFVGLAAAAVVFLRRSDAQLSDHLQGQFYLLSHFTNTFLFEYQLRERILTFSDNLPAELELEPRLEGAYCADRVLRVVHPDDHAKLAELVKHPSALRKEVALELRLRHKTGAYLWYECRVVATRDRLGRPDTLLGRFENIEGRKRREAGLVARSTRDDLTGLLNRSAVTLRVEEWIQSPGAREGGALFMLDLDNFKGINDALGHSTGDRALVHAARVLRETFREGDILGRVGGDEFLVFMPGVRSPALAAARAENLCQAMADWREEEAGVLSVSCSVGISLYPQDGDSYAVLFEAADAAMYQAKREGKNSYRLSALML